LADHPFGNMTSRTRLILVAQAAGCVLAAWAVLVAVIALGLYAFGGIAGGRIISPTTPELPVALKEYAYFAIVTTTTLGYGDYVPLGWFRIVASIDAIMGIVMAGVLVARITSVLVDPLSILQGAAGPWFDHVRIRRENGTTDEFVTLFEIEKQGGIWMCSGTNFNLSGTYRHRFNAHIIGVERGTLYIPYNNDVTSTDDYTSGIWVIVLSGSADSPWLSSYTHDLKFGCRDDSIGIKLNRRHDRKILEGLQAEAGAENFCEAIELGLERTRRIKPPSDRTSSHGGN
jgi:hypothetical protein